MIEFYNLFRLNVAYLFFRPDSCDYIRYAMSHLAIIVDTSKFTQFCGKKGGAGIIKAILLRSERATSTFARG